MVILTFCIFQQLILIIVVHLGALPAIHLAARFAVGSSVFPKDGTSCKLLESWAIPVFLVILMVQPINSSSSPHMHGGTIYYTYRSGPLLPPVFEASKYSTPLVLSRALLETSGSGYLSLLVHGRQGG